MFQQIGGRRSRPASLTITHDDKSHGDSVSHHPHHHLDSDKHSTVYMEIPHTTSPDKDKVKSTATLSCTSSISKDSLMDSSKDKAVDAELFQPATVSVSGLVNSSDTSTNPSLSFTVEFGDEKKPKLNITRSLSEFVPPKIRNSLASHARVEKSVPARSITRDTGNRIHSVIWRLFKRNLLIVVTLTVWRSLPIMNYFSEMS